MTTQTVIGQHTYGTSGEKCAMCPKRYRTLSRMERHTNCRGHCILSCEPNLVCKQGQGRESKQRHQQMPEQYLENHRRHEVIA